MIWEELTASVCLGSTAPWSAFIASKLRVEDFACMLSVRDFRETPQCVLAVLGSEFFAAIPSYILHCQEDRQNVQCHDLRLSPSSHDRTLLCYAYLHVLCMLVALRTYTSLFFTPPLARDP